MLLGPSLGTVSSDYSSHDSSKFSSHCYSCRPTFAEVVREVKAQLTEWRREHGGGVAVRPLRPSTDSAMGASSGN